MSRFVLVLGQGRSGSTLIMRLLNSVPGVHISGENHQAFSHLAEFLNCYAKIKNKGGDSFFSLAWALPPGISGVTDAAKNLVLSLYNPNQQFSIFGFKEVRYGKSYEDLVQDIDFMRRLFPDLRLILNVRDTATCVKSRWWAKNEERSRRILDSIRGNFERFYTENQEFCYWMPYEQLRKNSPELRGMFEFLGIDYRIEYERELDIIKR